MFLGLGGFVLYSKSYVILLNLNFYYFKIKKLISQVNLNKVKILKREFVDNQCYIFYEYDEREYISFYDEISIDKDKYDKFKNSLSIPNNPDNILNGTLNENIDCTSLLQKFCGPFVDQLNDENKEKIFKYLNNYYKVTDEVKNKIDIFMSDGNSLLYKL
tara:strand:+ start:354 stop:833 length:480 start_codon:yes stop_codon:yes gene_type:complete